MSVLSDVYISDHDTALSYDSDQANHSSFKRCEFKNLTPLEFSILQAIMEGREWYLADFERFTNLLTVDEGERMIHAFPQEFVALLADAEQADIAQAAEAWSRTEEWMSTPEDTQPLVEQLAHLARVAINEEKSMYLWNCI